eukprot:jgi/Tetstr1/432876/TSEL_022225.t1
METLLGVRHLTKKEDYMLSFDLQDGFYALCIAEAGRDYFTVDVRGQTQYLFLAIPAARLFLRELHTVVGDRWGGRVRMTPQLRRDLQWWTSVPSQSNGKPIHRPVETAYLHTDNSGYGWDGVLNARLEARGFWS